MTEEHESERRQAEYKDRSEMFMKALDVDETLALLLVGEGFRKLEEVAYVAADEFASIEGFDMALVEELQSRARDALNVQAVEAESKRNELGVEDDLTAIEGLTPTMLVTLGEAGIKTLDDLGDLAADELTSAEDGILRDYNLTLEQANDIIMAARAHWFDDEPEESVKIDAGEEEVG